jgi:hypothetical protein
MPPPHSPERSSRPVFIIGSHRSGTTLLRYCLDAHPNLACPPESKFIAALDLATDYPQVLEALGTLLSRKEIVNEFRVFIDRILSAYAAKQGKRRWVDKTPNYYRILPFIEEVFSGDALYIFVVRHPFGCVASLEKHFIPSVNHEDPDIARNTRLHGKGRYAWVMYWMDVYARIDAFSSAASGRCHTLRYEELVSDTPSVLRSVLNFIGEPYDESLAERAFQLPHTEGFQDPKIRATREVHRAGLCRWSEWPSSEIAALWRPAADLAAQFRYSCRLPDGIF